MGLAAPPASARRRTTAGYRAQQALHQLRVLFGHLDDIAQPFVPAQRADHRIERAGIDPGLLRGGVDRVARLVVCGGEGANGLLGNGRVDPHLLGDPGNIKIPGLAEQCIKQAHCDSPLG